MSKQIGSREERDLVNRLENEMGFPTVKIPASGAGTDRELPDVLTKLNGPRLAAIEAKYTAGDYTYVQEKEIEDLIIFANKWEAIPLIAVRFSQDRTWYGVPVREINEDDLTDGGALSLRRNRKGTYPRLERLLTYYSAYE